jgi:acyl-CoA thioester hydrolase
MPLGRSHANAPPEGVTTSTLLYRVPFFDTDGMRIVHHSNYVRYLELARVQMLAEHVAPYEDFVAQGLHFAVTRCELRYRQSARFGEEIGITCWTERVGGASLSIGYVLRRGDRLLATAQTDHAMVDDDGHPVRMARNVRAMLEKLAPSGAPS